MIFNINSTRGHTGSLLVFPYVGAYVTTLYISGTSQDSTL